MHACTCTYSRTHARTHAHTHTHLSYPLKQSITEPRNDSLLLLAVRGTHHCVGLATPCLPVGKDAGVVALKGILQNVLPEALIDIDLVCRGGGKGWGGVEWGGEGWGGVEWGGEEWGGVEWGKGRGRPDVEVISRYGGESWRCG